MPRRDPIVWLTASVAMISSGVTWGVWVATQASGALALALALQLVVGLAMAWVTSPERRALAAALGITVPVVGPLAAAWTADARGLGGAELLHDPHAAVARKDGAAIARRLTSALPSCEALVSGDIEARRATIARLGHRAGADDIAILRWARTQDDPEIAVEVALAFEEVGQRFEQRVASARAAVTAEPCFATHAALVTMICEGVLSGLVDAPLIGKLASEARIHHASAAVLDAASAVTLVALRARLELAVRRPEVALSLLKPAIRRNPSEELLQLYTDAAYAARRFELTPVFASRSATVAAA